MRRIVLYSVAGEKLFSGNLSDLPLDDRELFKDAQNRYGDMFCPQKLAAVKQTILVRIFESKTTDGEIIIPLVLKHYLKHKEAYKIVVYKQ